MGFPACAEIVRLGYSIAPTAERAIALTRPKNPALLRLLCWGVHLYTATGVLWGLLALLAIQKNHFAEAYVWMAVAVVVDSSDGPLARWLEVRRHVPEFDGALLDNIVDYLTWTFVPLMLVHQAGWMPAGWWPVLGVAMMSSLYNFSRADAKQSEKGFFRGFPSYWNFAVFIVDVGVRRLGPEAVALFLLGLSALSFAPVRFVYPNKATRFRPFFVWGSWATAPLFFAMFATYPAVPTWMLLLASVYPILYIALSIWLDVQDRLAERPAAEVEG